MPSWYATYSPHRVQLYKYIHRCTDGEVRLVGGSNETEGTVEVCHNKTWGMVSGQGWGEEDARVTCRQLQFSVEGMHCTCIMSLSLYCCRFPFLC